MTTVRSWAMLAGLGLALWLCCTPVAAQTESATAEDGAPATEAPAITTAPPVQVGANLTPPVGVLPPPIVPALSAGQPGDATVSTVPGTVNSGIAREGEHAERAPEAAPATEAATVTCADFPTWYDAQLTLESSVDTTVLASLDPDGDAIACEELMYP